MTPSPAAGGSAPSPYRGILLFILSGLTFACLDASAKFLARDYHVLQVVWGRYVFHMAALLVLMPGALLHRPFASKRPGLQVLRSVLLLAATGLFFFSLQFLQLAEATSIGFSSPLILTALAYFVLKERVGPRRWSAVIVGFVGVLIVIRPGAGAMHWAAFATLGMAFANASYHLVTRMLSGVDPHRTSLFYSGLVGALGCSLIVPFVWKTPDLAGWTMLALVGVLGATGHHVLIKAYTVTSPTLLAPYSYVQIIWTIALGFLLFSDLPDFWTLVGTAIIVASGIYVFYREAYLRRIGRI